MMIIKVRGDCAMSLLFRYNQCATRESKHAIMDCILVLIIKPNSLDNTEYGAMNARCQSLQRKVTLYYKINNSDLLTSKSKCYRKCKYKITCAAHVLEESSYKTQACRGLKISRLNFQIMVVLQNCTTQIFSRQIRYCYAIEYKL